MPITDEIKKTLSDPTPLYAIAGAGDLAYRKLREVPGRVEALAADRKVTQEKAAARFQEAQAKVSETVATLPADFKVLQEKAQSFALQQVGRAVDLALKAKERYDGLAEHGKDVVERGRGEEQSESAAAPELTGADADPAADAPAEGGEQAESSKPAEDSKPAEGRKQASAKKKAADEKSAE
ncbi:hypothetical protein ACWGB8_26710 [Kitasatospora sp. NPDC054939]